MEDEEEDTVRGRRRTCGPNNFDWLRKTPSEASVTCQQLSSRLTLCSPSAALPPLACGTLTKPKTIDAMRNILWVRSKFREDLYQNPTTSLQDAIARSDNFIRMEEDTNAILSKMNAPKAPAAKNANTRQEPRQHAPIDKNGRKDGYMYVINENNMPVSTLVVRGEGWNKWGNGEGDSSANEEQPANRRRIEVILSQQTLSSDVENDDTPVLEDLRDVLNRKFESKDSNISTHNDLRTTLDARKSRRISTGDPDPKERSNGDLRDKLNTGACDLRIRLNHSNSSTHNDLRTTLDARKSRRISTGDTDPKERSNGGLRDKLNAGACDLRIRLNRSKSTDLRRRLEQTKTSNNDTPS
ncbi:hypothetical protein F2Q69_00023881 [Brassica cretica]|uniref:Uncharacterized protein n=1 Tax=Brassica cretica TaxID=69181 RepID=A0A8S9QFF0_BRACR|nr:hypothetical protein F2Q69_00023881 [Brassica cretica]